MLRFLFDLLLVLLLEAVFYVIAFTIGFMLMDLLLRLVQ